MDTPRSNLGSLKTSKWIIIALACITVISTLYVYDDFMLDQSEGYESLTNRILRRRRKKKRRKSKGSSSPPADIAWVIGYPGSGHAKVASSVTSYSNVPASSTVAPRTLVTADCTGHCMISKGRRKCKNQYLKDSLSYSKWLSTCAGGARKRRKSKFASTESVKKVVIVKRDPFEIVYERFPRGGDFIEWCKELDNQALKKKEMRSIVKTIEENYAKNKHAHSKPLEFPPCFTEHLRIVQFYDNAMVLAKEKDTYVMDWDDFIITDSGSCEESGDGYGGGYGGYGYGEDYYTCSGYAKSWGVQDMTKKLVDAALLAMPNDDDHRRGCLHEEDFIFSGRYLWNHAAESCVYTDDYKSAMTSMIYYYMMSGDWTISRHEWY